MTTREIYKAAIGLFREACTTHQNIWNEDPDTNWADVDAITNRCIKAYEWCKANGLGEDYKRACSNAASSVIPDANIRNHKVFAVVFLGGSYYDFY